MANTLKFVSNLFSEYKHRGKIRNYPRTNCYENA